MGFSLSRAPLSLKVLMTLALIGMALTYVVLALHIYIDTQFSIVTIEKAYSTFEWTELVDHTHRYFPYYGIYIFAFALITLMLGTTYSEKIKMYFATVPNILIALDVGSMWAIRYIHAGIFSWVLFLAGTFLGLHFILLFFMILNEIWLKKEG